MYVAKTKALISFAVTAKLICVFVFAYAKRWFSHDAAHMFQKYWLQSKCNATVLMLNYLTQSRLITMLPFMIACRWVGPDLHLFILVCRDRSFFICCLTHRVTMNWFQNSMSD